MMFSPTVMADVAKEQQRDRLKEAEMVRLFQLSSDPSQSQLVASRPVALDHLRSLIGGYLRKYPART